MQLKLLPFLSLILIFTSTRSLFSTPFSPAFGFYAQPLTCERDEGMRFCVNSKQSPFLRFEGLKFIREHEKA